jgi:hypothetical protein
MDITLVEPVRGEIAGSESALAEASGRCRRKCRLNLPNDKFDNRNSGVSTRMSDALHLSGCAQAYLLEPDARESG